MDVQMIVIVVCFAVVIITISLVVILFLVLGRHLESDYIKELKGKETVLLEAMDKDTYYHKSLFLNDIA